MATSTSPLISSTADMISAVPTDLFDAMPEDTGETVEAAPVEIADEPAAAIEEPEPETGDEPAAEPADETPAETKPAAAATEDELPEGVRKGQDRKGKPGYFLEENRYQTFHGNHKLVQEASGIIGEPLTSDALRLRHEAYLGQERLFNDLTSGDAGAQTEVLKYIFNEMNDALKNGEVGVDPTIPFAESLYSTLKTQAPDAFGHLRHQAAKDLVTDIYEQAARTNDLNLYYSAQRLVAALSNVPPKPAAMSDEDYAAYVKDAAAESGFTFHTAAEMPRLAQPGEDPLASAKQQIADLQAKLNGRSQATTTEQYDTWSRNNIKEVNTAILDDAVKPNLASVEGGWKDFPDDYKRLVIDPLHREVVAAVKADPDLDQQVKGLQIRARRATSEQVRDSIGQQIKQLFVNRAKRAAEDKKAPIVKFAAEWLKGRSDQNHERRNSAQARTTPKGAGSPVKTSSLPSDIGFKDGIYDSKTALKQMQALFQ